MAFPKTRLLKSGETQLLNIEFSADTMASYDDLGKVQKSAYVLEAGDYVLYVGTSVREVEKINFVYKVLENRVVKQLSEKVVPTSLKKMMLSDGSFEELQLKEPNNPDECGIEKMSSEMTDGFTPEGRIRKSYQLWNDPFKKKLSMPLERQG